MSTTSYIEEIQGPSVEERERRKALLKAGDKEWFKQHPEQDKKKESK